MLDGKLFDLLEHVAQRVRGSSQPFGGLQLILSGDFHQVRIFRLSTLLCSAFSASVLKLKITINCGARPDGSFGTYSKTADHRFYSCSATPDSKRQGGHVG